MKVVLINPPQNTRYPQPPMGLALLGAILKRDGYEVTILDVNAYNVSLEYAEKLAVNSSVLYTDGVVGITAMTPTINSALRIAESIKHFNPDFQIILGGVHATLLPQETLDKSPEINMVVKGEGDNAIIEILKSGIRGDIQTIYENHSSVDMDSLPYLAYYMLPWTEYKPHPPHGRALPWLPMITSRGCSFSCGYCSKAVFGNKFRAQSPKRVVDEIANMQTWYKVKEIAFYDDVFTLDKKRAYSIAEEILRRGLKLCWTCETRADLVDKELLEIMKKAGCYSISYGIESASQDVLDIIGKGIAVEQSEEAVRLTREAGIQTVGYFMIGSPNETPETIRQTIDFAKKLKLDYAQFAIATPFPNTKLYEYYKNDHGDLDMLWDSFIYAGIGNKISPMFDSMALSRGDIKYWVDKAYKEFYMRPSYIWQRLSRVRSVGDLGVLAKGLIMLKGI